MKLVYPPREQTDAEPAAFRRLCVETKLQAINIADYAFQPPSGGCVLKLAIWRFKMKKKFQPPSGGCVLKR